MINGHSPDQPVDAAAAHAAAVAQVKQFVNTTMAVTLNGMLHSGPAIPGELIIEAACETMGTMIGNMYQGENAAVFAFRKRCRDAFAGALKAVPVRSPPKTVDLGASLAAMDAGARKQ